MDAESGYDMSNLKALRLDLERLNAAALKSGLIAVRDGWTETQEPAVRAKRSTSGPSGKKTAETRAKASPGKPPQRKATAAAPAAEAATTAPGAQADHEINESGDKGKAGAKRLLAMCGRVAGDKSPTVLGTHFTESGVVRLLAHLRKPRSRNSLFLQRLYRLLDRPVAMGIRTSAGISVEALQVVSRQLVAIEAHGWHHFQSRLAERRGRPAAPVEGEAPRKPRRPKVARASKNPEPK